MDDNNDQEFNFASNNEWGVEFKPDPNDISLNGLGLEVKVRGMQWRKYWLKIVSFFI